MSRLGLAALVLAVGALLLVGPPPVHAAFIVNHTADVGDDNPGDGICDTGAGNCTLRAAIQETNALPGADSITLPAGTYALTIPGRLEDAAASGDLDITDDLTISGAGAASTIVDGALDRVFDIKGSSVVRITGVTIRNGNDELTVDGGAAAINGGGILNEGTLALTDSTVSSNNASDGGGIFNVGTLTLTNSAVSFNAVDNFFGDGGGIYNSGGTLSLKNSTVSGNTAGQEGGGIYSFGDVATLTLTDNSIVKDNSARIEGGGIYSAFGTISLTDTTVHGNIALGTNGGGIVNRSEVDGIPRGSGPDPTLTLIGSTVSFNEAAADGGGIWNSGTTILTNSAVANNSAGQFGLFPSGEGAGIWNKGTAAVASSTIRENRAIEGGGIFNDDDGTLTVIDSTVSGNLAGAIGGGIWNKGDVTITNSTVSFNTSETGVAGGIYNYYADATLTNTTVSGNRARAWGGGIYAEGGTLNLSNVTIASNIADTDGVGLYDGGGIQGNANVKNTIIARNAVLNSDPSRDSDCSGTLTSQGYNLVQTISPGCNIVGDTSGNIYGQDPLLGPLQDNGGPTQTRALQSGSVAIDAGNPAPPGSSGSACAATDQRGDARPQGLACDIGAYETEPMFIFAPKFTVTRTDDPVPDGCNALFGGCSLREAIIAANTTPGLNTISLPAGTYTLSIGLVGENGALAGDLDITEAVNIQGDGAAVTVIDGGRLDRVFHIIDAAVTISDVTIQGGDIQEKGGGIYNDSGVLRLHDSAVTGNFARLSGGGIWNSGAAILTNSTVSDNQTFVGTTPDFAGGGIYNAETAALTLTDSTVSGNFAPKGGGIWNSGTAAVTNSTVSDNHGPHGGGIWNSGIATVNNSTMSGNTANLQGAGIWNSGTATLSNSTINGNTAGVEGGGVYSASTLNLTNTIIAGNTDLDVGGGTTNPDCYGSLTSQGYNLVESISPDCTIVGITTGNITGVDPVLGPLAENGGPTRTHALLPGSPAIDTGNPAAPGSGGNACLATDQRGIARPQGSACDMGAYEAATTPGITTMTEPASQGRSEIAVASTAGFAQGDAIRINPGGANEEENTVAGFGSILLASPLQFDHDAGELVETVTSLVTIATPTQTTTVPATASATATATPPAPATVQATVAPQVTATPTATATPTPPALGTPPPALVGDVDCGGSVNSIDAALILQFVAGLLGSLACPEGADTNGNGDINSIDAALVLQFTAGLLLNLPA